MKRRHESLLVDLARIVTEYGANELIALARAMRDPVLANEIAALLEEVAAKTRGRDSRRKAAARLHESKPPNTVRASVVRNLLRDAYETFDTLDPLLEQLGLNPNEYKRISEAHEAILRLVASSVDASRLMRDIADTAVRPAGELDQLTEAIVTNRGKRS